MNTPLKKPKPPGPPRWLWAVALGFALLVAMVLAVVVLRIDTLFDASGG